STFIPFKKSYNFTLILSITFPIIIIIIQFVFYPFTLSVLLIMGFFMIENMSEWKNKSFVFRRFLFSRLMNSHRSEKLAVLMANENDELIDLFSRFKREYSYIIYLSSNKMWTDVDCLRMFFYSERFIKYVRDL